MENSNEDIGSNVVIKKSFIGQFSDGKGVFANRNFKKGEVVIQYHLKPLTQEEWLALSENERGSLILIGSRYISIPSQSAT